MDDVATAREQAGPVIAALRDGDLEPADVLPLGQVVAGHAEARHSPDDIVFYNSVGLGIQDAAAIDRIITVARRIGMGRLIHL